MRQRLLTQLIHAPADLDYVERFQQLSAVNLEMRRHGPSGERLLRKAILEMDVGNFSASLTAAQDAAVIDPRNAEAHFQVARAFILLGLVRAGALPVGPGQRAPEESTTALVTKAMETFRTVLRLNTEDGEAAEDLAFLHTLVAAHPTETGLVRALRAL